MEYFDPDLVCAQTTPMIPLPAVCQAQDSEQKHSAEADSTHALIQGKHRCRLKQTRTQTLPAHTYSRMKIKMWFRYPLLKITQVAALHLQADLPRLLEGRICSRGFQKRLNH